MKEYIDEKICIEDLKLLRQLADADKKNLQIGMIDALANIYGLSDDSLKYADAIEKNYKYCVNMWKNLIKSAVVSVGGFIGAINFFDKDPDLAYSVLSCTGASVIGWCLFQKLNKEENYVPTDILVEASENYQAIFDRIQEFTNMYFDKAELYFEGKNDYIVKDEMRNVFLSNEGYIKQKIANGEYKKDFSFETMCEVAEDYFNSDVMKQVFSYSKDKQKQRKL